MKKIAGITLIVVGVLLIITSIMALVRAFDIFTAMDSSAESVGYTIGSIVFPLLLTVIGRWIFRKGKSFLLVKG